MPGFRVMCLIFLLFLPENVNLLQNGLALTPPMGWMSWGYYMCGTDCRKHPEKCLDEKLILSVVDAFFLEGYQEAGYEYIIIDDCWSEKKRDANGRLVADKKRFPNGMKYIADYIHERNLKFGMYTNIATTTCMGYPGSRKYFDIDAQMFAEWDVDYLKVDGCFVEEDYLNTSYIDLGRELEKAGRPMVYSCSWPYYIKHIHKKEPDYEPIQQHCNVYRNYHDVFYSWEAVHAIVKHYEQNYETYSPYHGPGHWNDPDMLILGAQVLKENQSRVQLVVYIMLSAPILLSCDMNKITTYEKSLLQNMDLIAIGQDPLGIMAKPHALEQSVVMWVKPHLPKKGDQFNTYSFAIVNLDSQQHLISFYPAVYGLNSSDGYSVLNVLTNVFLRNVTLRDSIEVTVPSEDVVLFTLYPL